MLCTRVTRTRAPEAPIGCPRAMAPPLTLTRCPSTPSWWTTASAWAANASFNSNRSTLSKSHPALATACRTALTGPRPMTDGSRPVCAYDTIRPNGASARRSNSALETSTTAAAPSFSPDALPAVTVPVPSYRVQPKCWSGEHIGRFSSDYTVTSMKLYLEFFRNVFKRFLCDLQFLKCRPKFYWLKASRVSLNYFIYDTTFISLLWKVYEIRCGWWTYLDKGLHKLHLFILFRSMITLIWISVVHFFSGLIRCCPQGFIDWSLNDLIYAGTLIDS